MVSEFHTLTKTWGNLELKIKLEICMAATRFASCLLDLRHLLHNKHIGGIRIYGNDPWRCQSKSRHLFPYRLEVLAPDPGFNEILVNHYAHLAALAATSVPIGMQAPPWGFDINQAEFRPLFRLPSMRVRTCFWVCHEIQVGMNACVDIFLVLKSCRSDEICKSSTEKI
ncbi:hypothetical protein BDV97DRAFT_163906 [Delphinella strobiligena]|nr:hypothetical protein BDV97DRAFT_163906 [Delphinella strobiligena]